LDDFDVFVLAITAGKSVRAAGWPGLHRAGPAPHQPCATKPLAQVEDIKPEAVQYVLLDLPGLLFFTTYTLLVLFWAEIYHQARHASPAS
jgi:hypothetical protein